MTVALEQAVALPFKISSSGSVQSTTDQAKIWADRVLSVIGTGPGERIQNYEFGSTLFTSVYSTVDAAIAILEDKVSEAFMTHLPLLSYKGLQTSYDMEAGILSVTVTYALPNLQETNATIGSVVIQNNLPPKDTF
jgi:phage baseplate assembly protein W